MTDHIIKAYAEDVNIRLRGLEPSKPRGYVVNVHEIKTGVIYRDENVTVKAFATSSPLVFWLEASPGFL